MQMASFYICDENWNKGMEITQFDMTDLSEDMDSEEIDLESIKPIMADSRIADFIKEPLQKMIYVYDFIEMWTIKIQLLGIKDEIKGYVHLINSAKMEKNILRGVTISVLNKEHKLIKNITSNFCIFNR